MASEDALERPESRAGWALSDRLAFLGQRVILELRVSKVQGVSLGLLDHLARRSVLDN